MAEEPGSPRLAASRTSTCGHGFVLGLTFPCESVARLSGVPAGANQNHVSRSSAPESKRLAFLLREGFGERSTPRCAELEDGSYSAEVRGLKGVVAIGDTFEACRTLLEEVVEEWVLVRVSRGLDVPALGGVKIRVRNAI